MTVPRVFRKTAQAHPRRECLVFEDVRWTFQDLEDYSNRVANFFLRRGYKPGEVVALFMDNRPVSARKRRKAYYNSFVTTTFRV